MRSHRFGALNAAAVAVLAAVALLLTGCSSDSGSGSGSTDDAASGPWTFKDDQGKTVKLDHTPTRVAGLNDVLVSLMNYGVKPVASFGYTSLADDHRFDGLDTKGITEVGTSFGEINLEKLAAAKPDVIVTNVYPTDAKGTIDKTQADYGFKDLSQEKQVEKIAPVVTLYMGGDGEKVVKRTTDFATAVGAKASVVAAAKEKFDAAEKSLAAAGKETRIKVTVVYADGDGLYGVKAKDDPALRMYQDLGVPFTEPTPKGYYWGIYSWENAGKLGGDMLLLSQTGYQQAELKKQATFADNAALKSGQVHDWTSAGMDYVSQADYMNRLASWIKESKVVSK
ncbi:ABC transporter substrate-binding protein [Streptomyces sp. NPDC008150]|uniref:ABC transporter substrate-binding protein n=1 Tax=Streptomyces sp. NPDC008150 TaxID=3364816 RepID=UPI0036E00773